MLITLLLAALAADVAGTIYDVAYTEKGIKKGVGVEANPIVDKLAGTNKPGAVILYVENCAFMAVLFGVAVAAVTLGKGHGNLLPIGFAGGALGLLADGVKHVQGGLSWRYLLKGGKLDYEGFPIPADGKAVGHGIWAKIIGPWC